ncbi:hypothetical protein Krac_6425 [Ktedonobacter racemifer DSM 44963]|uniref:Uncharacterized protein n=1 Tax=Ktedonobacter racemifer DSM 44963 TaxID=485913 RepID=D6TUR7_KTERA|nr:hypothetical protein Krac_6425 [Ktedonobacter racemifer DSM 44963]
MSLPQLTSCEKSHNCCHCFPQNVSFPYRIPTKHVFVLQRVPGLVMAESADTLLCARWVQWRWVQRQELWEERHDWWDPTWRLRRRGVCREIPEMVSLRFLSWISYSHETQRGVMGKRRRRYCRRRGVLGCGAQGFVVNRLVDTAGRRGRRWRGRHWPDHQGGSCGGSWKRHVFFLGRQA